MTDIQIHQPAAIAMPDQAAAPGTDLVLWARQAEAAAIYAERVCSTTMAPAAYRGKAAEAAAAILAGAELGFSPMASLRAFDNIQGTPAPKAMTLRAVVQAAGHEIRTVESTDERAVVDGRRRGDTEWQTSIWDMGRAQKLAQFKSNPNYTTNPAQMLVARATAEVCRWVGADAIMGMPYAAEEVGDIVEAAPAPTTRRLTVAALDPVAVDPVAQVADIGAATAEGQPDPDRVDPKQHRAMHGLWRDLGFGGEENRDTRLQITAKILGLPDLESSADLTREQGDTVIAALRDRKATQAQDGEPR